MQVTKACYKEEGAYSLGPVELSMQINKDITTVVSVFGVAGEFCHFRRE